MIVLEQPYTLKVLKIRTPEKFAVTTIKFEQGGLA